jgi:hypothetical protein
MGRGAGVADLRSARLSASVDANPHGVRHLNARVRERPSGLPARAVMKP